MFNKLKQIKDLKNQAKTVQSALSEVVVNADSKGVALTMNGNMEVLNITISPEAKQSADLEANIKNCFNDALKKTQMAMAKKMQEMGSLPGLGDLLK